MRREAGAGGVAVRRFGRRPARAEPIRARPETCWDEVLRVPVEVTTPDRESARVLLDEAMGHFHAELLETDESAMVVRLRPALAAPAGWVFEFLALVERWLDACNLQVASVHHGSRSYVITAVPPGSQSDGGPEPAVAV
jgi:hypothetical protein